ncbi:MAG: GDSL-type esterase/lipase family protein [Bacteroidota bacterium]|nr:GDSL-type esterase/lipase family protein [Bacteroidota bacterium]
MRTVLFKIAAIALPLVLLAATEGIVRIFEHEPFLIPVPGEPEYQTVNPAYAGRYFRGFIPQPAYNPFLRQKPDEVFRIIALGGSSTAGYPYSFNSGFPERVAAGLRAIYPTRQVEVINLGMTALSSHVVRNFVPHVLRIQPDAVLIYAGHNEYYGAYGAGGMNRSRVLTRTLFWFKRSVLFRKLERLIAPPVQSNRTMMAQSTTDVTIAFGGPVYQAGVENFETNMSAILERFEKAGIPTYVGTLVSNLQSQPPLGVDSVANVAWVSGQEHWTSGDTAAALASFVLAKEHDPIRFRAPEAMNQILIRLSERHAAVLVDLEPQFGPDVRDSLFTDHIHPTALGYDRMARVFVSALVEDSSHISPDLGAPEAAPLDTGHARLLIARLRLGFPFTIGLSEAEELSRFGKILRVHRESGRSADSLAALAVAGQLPIYEALLKAKDHDLAARDTVQALAHMRSLLYWQPFNERLHMEAAELASYQSSNLAGEVMQLIVARDPSESYLNTLAALRIRQGALERAGSLLRSIETDNPESAVMLFNMARYLVQVGDTLNAEAYFRRYQQVVRRDP